MFDQIWRAGLYSPDDGGGTDNGSGGNDADAEAKAKAEADAKAAAEAEAKKSGGDDEKKFSQKELDNIIKDRLERQEKKAKEEAEKARKKAEEDALEKNKEFEKLAEGRLAEIETLKAENAELLKVKEQAEKYKGALEAHLKTQIEQLPKPIQALMEKLDPVEQIEFLAKNAKDLGVSKKMNIDETPNGGDKELTKEQRKQGEESSANIIRNAF